MNISNLDMPNIKIFKYLTYKELEVLGNCLVENKFLNEEYEEIRQKLYKEIEVEKGEKYFG